MFLQRIRIEEIKRDPWFRRNHVAARHGKDEEVNLDDVCAVFNDIEVGLFAFCFQKIKLSAFLKFTFHQQMA